MDLLKAAENEFQGADLDALREYCDKLGVEYHPNNNADTLRKRLTAALGEYNEVSDGTADDVPDEEKLDTNSQQEKIRALVGLNLRSTGKWEGKRRVIQLHRSMSHDNTTRPQFFAWGRLHVYVPFGVACAIPYPIYNILKDTSGQKLTRKRRVDDDGRIYYEDQWIANERFMYSDMGDDPETIDRPASERERLAMLHSLTDGFAGFSERQFRAMCLSLHIQPKDHWTAADMKGAIAQRCGLTRSAVDLSAPEEAVA